MGPRKPNHALRHMGQVHVDEVDVTGIDGLAGRRVGVEGQALAQGLGFGHHAVAFRGGGRGPDIDLVRLAGGMFGLGTGGNGLAGPWGSLHR
jgi:hypothetical protein